MMPRRRRPESSSTSVRGVLVPVFLLFVVAITTGRVVIVAAIPNAEFFQHSCANAVLPASSSTSTVGTEDPNYDPTGANPIPPLLGLGAAGDIYGIATPCQDFYAGVCSLYGPLHIDDSTNTTVAVASDRSLFSTAAAAARDHVQRLVQAHPLYDSCTRQTKTNAPWWSDYIDAPDLKTNEFVADQVLHAVLVNGVDLPITFNVDKALDRSTYALEMYPDVTAYVYVKSRASHDVELIGFVDTLYAALDTSSTAIATSAVDTLGKTTVADEDAIYTAYAAEYVTLEESKLSSGWQEALTRRGVPTDALLHLHGALDYYERFLELITPSILNKLHSATYELTMHPLTSEDLTTAELRLLPTLAKIRQRVAERRKPQAATAAETSPVDHCYDLVRDINMRSLNREFLIAAFGDTGNDVRAKAVHALLNDVHTTVRSFVADSNEISLATRTEALLKYTEVRFSVLGSVSPALLDIALPPYVPPTTPFTFGDHLRDRRVELKTAAFALLQRNFSQDRTNDLWRMALAERDIPYETVNAWYNPTRNDVTLPPGITLSPMFRGDGSDYDLAVLGTVLGHELGHATDVSGSRFDAVGNWVAGGGWWAAEDLQAIEDRMACLAQDYGHPCQRPDYGWHTMGEDMADQLGVRVTYSMLAQLVGLDTPQGLSRRREFFVNYARLWCARPHDSRLDCKQVSNDVHALAKHRVNKTLRQLTEFTVTFACSDTTICPMINPQRCLVY